MKMLRAIVALVVSLSLPFSAMATTLNTLHCHHDGLGALVDAASSTSVPPCHEHHAMEAPGGASLAKKAGDHGCDCAVKCSCQHHCSTGGGLAAMPVRQHLPSYARTSVATWTRAALVTAAQAQRLFRPPITAPPGAA